MTYDTTTIQVKVTTRKKLIDFKHYKRETYDEVINRLFEEIKNDKEKEKR